MALGVDGRPHVDRGRVARIRRAELVGVAHHRGHRSAGRARQEVARVLVERGAFAAEVAADVLAVDGDPLLGQADRRAPSAGAAQTASCWSTRRAPGRPRRSRRRHACGSTWPWCWRGVRKVCSKTRCGARERLRALVIRSDGDDQLTLDVGMPPLLARAEIGVLVAVRVQDRRVCAQAPPRREQRRQLLIVDVDQPRGFVGSSRVSAATAATRSPMNRTRSRASTGQSCSRRPNRACIGSRSRSGRRGRRRARGPPRSHRDNARVRQRRARVCRPQHARFDANRRRSAPPR